MPVLFIIAICSERKYYAYVTFRTFFYYDSYCYYVVSDLQHPSIMTKSNYHVLFILSYLVIPSDPQPRGKNKYDEAVTTDDHYFLFQYQCFWESILDDTLRVYRGHDQGHHSEEH